MPAPFERLVRFKNHSGEIFYGELGLDDTPTKEDLIGRKVQVYTGIHPWDEDFKVLSSQEKIVEV